MLEPERVQKLMADDVIEVAPLAFMRGRTLNDAFVILDEAQNTTVEQMKMFLTRLGFGAKAVVTGDPSQTDLPPGQRVHLAIDSIDLLAPELTCRFVRLLGEANPAEAVEEDEA